MSDKEIIKEKDYWKGIAEFRLKIIIDLEKQLNDHGITPFSETREKGNVASNIRDRKI